MALFLETEPRDLMLDDDNDIVIENGDLVFVRGVPAVAQACRIALSMFRGEWFLDLDAGIPYFQQILGAKRDAGIAIANAEIRDALLSVDGVVEIIKLALAFDAATRSLNVTWQVRTAFGATPVDVINLGAE